MPIGQKAYSQAIAFPGQVMSIQTDTFSHSAQDETVNTSGETIPYGSFVVADPNAPAGTVGALALPSAAGQTIVGLAPIQGYWTRSGRNASNLGGEAGIPSGFNLTYFYKGVFAVVTETAVNRGDSVFVRHTDEDSPSANEYRGRIRNDAAAGNAAALAGDYRVLDNGVAGSVVRIELSFSSTLLV